MFIRRYIILNPNFHNFDAILNRNINKHKEEYVECDVRCVLKLLTFTNCFRYNIINPKSSVEYTFKFSKNSILSQIKQDPYYFSKIFEMRNSFVGSIRNMTYEYYLKQPKSMCEIKLNEIIARNPRFINFLNTIISHPLIRKHFHFSQS